MAPGSLQWLLVAALLLIPSFSLLTSNMAKKRFGDAKVEAVKGSDNEPVITTSCNRLDLSKVYNYSGIAASGYLPVGRGNSALAFIFYGQKDVRSQAQLRNYPTILWLNGGPGSSSQIGNLQQIGPLRLEKLYDLTIKLNPSTWANKYNLLFIDQPVGTGLSYADSDGAYVKNLKDAADDFYRALYELYNGKGCFSVINFSIPPSNPLIIFGESYGGKYAPVIARTIIEKKEAGGFLTGLKGVAIGDGFTFPYEILSEVGTYSYHLGLLDFQERMRLEKVLINASRHAMSEDYDALHIDFDTALEYIVERAGNINVYDIKKDGDYVEVLQPYFRDPAVLKDIYKLNPEIVYDSQSDNVYDALNTDFMKSEINAVEQLLYKGIPVLIYNGQDDLIVQNPGTMKWVDRIHFTQAEEFRRKLFTPWKLNGKVVGAIKSAGLLEFRIVNKAGHLVPMDRPEEALDMATSFVERVIRM